METRCEAKQGKPWRKAGTRRQRGRYLPLPSVQTSISHMLPGPTSTVHATRWLQAVGCGSGRRIAPYVRVEKSTRWSRCLLQCGAWGAYEAETDNFTQTHLEFGVCTEPLQLYPCAFGVLITSPKHETSGFHFICRLNFLDFGVIFARIEFSALEPM